MGLRISLVVAVLIALLLAPGFTRRSTDQPECRIQIAGVEQFPGVASPEHPICEQAFSWKVHSTPD
jgi:hypothetical protein